MRTIKETLHEKRKTTEYHIKQLQHEGKQGIRYTAMMPDIPFLILGLMSDIGWLTHLIAGIIYFCGNGFRYVLDYAAFLALAGILFGVVYLIYLNKIHEKEIATKIQKNLSFGMTVYSGLAGAVIGILQFVLMQVLRRSLYGSPLAAFLTLSQDCRFSSPSKKGFSMGCSETG